MLCAIGESSIFNVLVEGGLWFVLFWGDLSQTLSCWQLVKETQSLCFLDLHTLWNLIFSLSLSLSLCLSYIYKQKSSSNLLLYHQPFIIIYLCFCYPPKKKEVPAGHEKLHTSNGEIADSESEVPISRGRGRGRSLAWRRWGRDRVRHEMVDGQSRGERAEADSEVLAEGWFHWLGGAGRWGREARW